MYKKIITLILTIAVVLSLVSCGEDYTHCELTLPLSEDFEKEKTNDFDLLYTNGKAAVAVVRMSHSAAIVEGIPDYLTAYEFGALWLTLVKRDAEMVSTPEVDYTTYYEISGEIKSFYLASFYRTPYAYFTVLYCVDASLEDEWRVKFLDFATKTSINLDYSE